MLPRDPQAMHAQLAELSAAANLFAKDATPAALRAGMANNGHVQIARQ